ncbi:hypothetical protein SCLCIDRAFT_145217 [Scleroderma citrinum Foug A]|uniref:Uncharacterized protein n=1 Tax=Scleroderma citrinum Foug A TaxID=1036808 RepID=A0A0C2YLD2_9AGAM|nr:hypothetical protein SCLCIDRAFT_145217 [Scleroderma citrinum Foug A]
MKDAGSTGNLCKHVRLCWGEEILNTADTMRDAGKVQGKIIPKFLRDGSITATFQWKAKGKITYSHCLHMCNRGFQSLMRTGCPGGCYLPLFWTVAQDVHIVFAHTCGWIAKMLQVRKINFTTDAWTSPIHWAFVVFCVHLEHDGKLLTMPLDLIEVPNVHRHTILCDT